MSRSFGDNAKTLFSNEVASLANGAEIDTGFLSIAQARGLLLDITGDASGLTIVQTNRFASGGSETVTTIPLPTAIADIPLQFPARTPEIRLQLQNNTGSAITNVRFLVKDTIVQPTVTPLIFDPLPQSQAQLTQSVLIGRTAGTELDAPDSYANAVINQAGALLVSEAKVEYARGLLEGYTYGVKFGRNPDIDTGTTPEDIYNGGGEYTGFNATANEEISATSADVNDTGSLVSSGTATGGTNTTLIDTGATFVTDGVAVGDLVINDTQGIHGVVTSVDSETQLTVFQMIDGVAENISNVAGDAYRVATSTSTGGAVLRLTNVLDQDYTEQTAVYIILNGTTTVTTSGVNAMRAPSGRIVLAGSTGRNEGEITVTQAVTTANVYCVIPTFGATTIGAFTVPAGKDCLITAVEKSITRASGALGSATIAVNVRRFGQGFNAERVFEINTSGSPVDETILGPFPPGTDIKGTVETVSDNNTIAQIEFEYLFIDR